MLACARIGAIHSVVFGGFAAASLATRIDDATAEGDGHLRRRHARRQAGAVQAPGRRGDPARRASAGQGAHRQPRPRPGDAASSPGATSTTRRCARGTWTRRCRASGSNRPSRRTSSTRRARPASRRASSATPAATRSRSRRRCATSSASRRAKRCSRPATSAGSSATRTSSTRRCINGSTTIMYEGLPIRPDPAIWWKIVEENKVKTMFSSPTAIRVLKKQDPAFMKKHDLSSLRVPVPRRRAARRADRALGVRRRWRRGDRRQLLADGDRLADPLRAARRRGHAAQVRQPVVSGLRLRRAAAAARAPARRSAPTRRAC